MPIICKCKCINIIILRRDTTTCCQRTLWKDGNEWDQGPQSTCHQEDAEYGGAEELKKKMEARQGKMDEQHLGGYETIPEDRGHGRKSKCGT